MTYDQFIENAKAAQQSYIDGENRRMDAAKALWQKYEDAMRGLGLQALTDLEIRDRVDQLADMERRIDETHGPSVAMRAAWATRVQNEEPGQ